MDSVYAKTPYEKVDGIPIFAEKTDPYIVNYQRIAEDHLAELAQSGQSPFMTESQTTESLADTRKVIKKYVREGGRILDAGVGCGLLLKNFGSYQKYGADVAIPYLKVARDNGIEVAMAKLEKLPYNDRIFDSVVVCDVLEHVFGLDQVLMELMRVLTPSGYLIVRVPNDECLDGYLTNLQPYEHSHVRGFNLVSLRLLLEKCFNLRYVDHCYTAKIFGISSQLRYFPVSKTDQFCNELNDLLQQAPSLAENPYMDTMIRLARLSVEEMVDSVLGLRETMPEVYARLAPFLIKPAEVVAVFQKKA